MDGIIKAPRSGSTIPLLEWVALRRNAKMLSPNYLLLERSTRIGSCICMVVDVWDWIMDGLCVYRIWCALMSARNTGIIYHLEVGYARSCICVLKFKDNTVESCIKVE